MDAQGRSGSLALRSDPLPVFLEQADDPCCSIKRLVCCLRHAVEEELEPGFPSTAFTHLLQEPVVVPPVRLEVETQVEERRVQDPMHLEKQGDEQPANAAVAVKKRVDRLELDMKKSGLDQRPEAPAVRMHELFKCIK